MPGIVGGCLNNKTKWTHVKGFGCYSFQYSGCGGNDNKFESKNESLHFCMDITSLALSKEFKTQICMWSGFTTVC